MTIINKIFAPKDNADDEVLVSRLFFSNGQKIKKNDDLAELETSKTSISISSEEDGFIEYCVNEDDYVKVGEVIILIHSSKKALMKLSFNQNKIKMILSFLLMKKSFQRTQESTLRKIISTYLQLKNIL